MIPPPPRTLTQGLEALFGADPTALEWFTAAAAAAWGLVFLLAGAHRLPPYDLLFAQVPEAQYLVALLPMSLGLFQLAVLLWDKVRFSRATLKARELAARMAWTWWTLVTLYYWGFVPEVNTGHAMYAVAAWGEAWIVIRLYLMLKARGWYE